MKEQSSERRLPDVSAHTLGLAQGERAHPPAHGEHRYAQERGYACVSNCGESEQLFEIRNHGITEPLNGVHDVGVG